MLTDAADNRSAGSLNYIVYVVYHDKASEQQARTNFGHFPWIRFHWIPSTKYFESHFLVHELLSKREEWDNYDYVGFLTYKARQKAPMGDHIEESIAEAIATNADIIPFLYFPDCNMVEWAQSCHPQFAWLWYRLCNHLGYSPAQYMSKEIPTYYANYWLMKKELLVDYLQHLQKAHQYLETEPSIQERLYSNAQYGILPVAMREIIPHYTHHCFLLERIPCIYFWAHQYRLQPYQKK